MDKKATGILSYLGFFWIVAYLAGDKEGAKFHLNQGLVIFIAEVILSALGFVPIVKYVASVVSLVLLVFAIIGIIAAANGEEKKLPIIGEIQILK